MKLTTIPFLFLLLATSAPLYASTEVNMSVQENFLDELDPSAPDAMDKVLEMDQLYMEATGESPFLSNTLFSMVNDQDCYRESCRVWADIRKSEQKLYFYIDGVLKAVWPVSSAAKGYTTPNFDKHPNGRIYNKYSSTKYPGGDYIGLGNMPYAIFINGPYAIHGTTRGNFAKLGTPASHGCIRLHPDNAKILNEYVRANGVEQVWFTVRN